MMWIMVNVPLMVVFFALVVGIPAWLVLKHPDSRPALAVAPAARNPVRRLERSHQDAGYQDAGYRHVA